MVGIVPHLTPTPEQEAAVLEALRYGSDTAKDIVVFCWDNRMGAPRWNADGRRIRGWLRHLLIEGKVRRVAVGPERWGLAA